MPAALSKSSKKAATPHKALHQRNYVITCEGIIIVFKTVVPGSLFIITGDGKQKCIEIKVDPASVGQPAVAGTDRPRHINVRATIRTLHVDGGPVKKEEAVEIKVEEWDEVEGKIATSDQDALSVAAEPHAPTPALESSTQKRVSKLPASVIKSKDVEPKASKASASSASGSSAAPRPTVKHTTKSAMPPTDVAPAAAVPPAKSSPQKRVASEMDSESDDSRKRVRVKEKPLRSQRKTRATQNAA